MKKFLALLFLGSVLLTSCSVLKGSVEDKNQPVFVRQTAIPEDKCVVYIYRIPSIVGSAVTHNIKVFAKRETNFPPVGKFVYGYLHQESYIPVVLDANKLYRINAASLLYFKGEPGSECVYKVEGTERSFSCISGGASAYYRRLISADFEKQLIASEEGLNKFTGSYDPELMNELSTMRLSSVIKPMIYK